MILVDSSVWIDYFRGRVTSRTDQLDQLLASERLLTGDLIMVEVLQGFRSDSDFARGLELFGRLEFEPLAGREVGIAAARNYRALRQRGVTVRGTIDVLIASFCIVNDHLLLHSDHDFDAFERHLGLKVFAAPN